MRSGSQCNSCSQATHAESETEAKPDIHSVLAKYPGVQIVVKNEDESTSKKTRAEKTKPAVEAFKNGELCDDVIVKQENFYEDNYDDNGSDYSDKSFPIQYMEPEIDLEANAQPYKKRKYTRRQDHPVEQDSSSTYYPCKICLANYISETHLTKCMTTHQRYFDIDDPVSCPVCDTVSESRTLFSDHYNAEHKEGKKHCCCVCLQIIDGGPVILKKHINKEHQNVKVPKNNKGRIITIRGDWIRNVYEVCPDKTSKIDPTLLQKGYKPAKGAKVIYECKICLRRSENWDSIRACFRLHERLWDLKQNMDCPLCKESIVKLEITHHIDLNHPNAGQTCCVVCGQLVDNADGKLRTHILKVHGDDFRSILCTWCGKHFQNNLRLSDHIARVHERPNAFLCPECGTSLPTKVDFNYHMASFHNPYAYKCPHCDKSFKDKRILYNHLFTHRNVKPFRCSVCGYSGCKRYHVRVHITNAHHKKGCEAAELITDDLQLAEVRKMVKYEIRCIIKAHEENVNRKLS